MLKAITNIINSVQFPIATSSDLKKGDIAQLTVEGNSVCLTRSDGTAPLGVLTRKVRVVGKKTRAVKHCVGEVRYGSSLYETDNYNPQCRYPINANLFIDQEGRFTTERPTPTHPVVGMVLTCPTVENHLLQLFWL